MVYYVYVSFAEYCWTVRRVFSLWMYAESWLTKIWTLTLSLGVTAACLYASHLSPQWSPPSVHPSQLQTESRLQNEDVLVLCALAFNVSYAMMRCCIHCCLFHASLCNVLRQIVFVFGIEMLYLNAKPSSEQKLRSSAGDVAAATSSKVPKRARSPMVILRR